MNMHKQELKSVGRNTDGGSPEWLFKKMKTATDRVVVTGGADFAIAQVRYQLAQLPPQNIVLILATLLLL